MNQIVYLLASRESPNGIARFKEWHHKTDRTASWDIVTKCHCETVETTTKDDYRIALNFRCRNIELSGALSTEGTDWDVSWTAYRNECRMTISEAYKLPWPMLQVYEYNYWWASHERHWLQWLISDTSELADKVMHEGSGERKCPWLFVAWVSISWEAYKIDTRSIMIDHHQRLWYRDEKLQSMPRCQAHFIHAEWALIWLPKQQQWSLMNLASIVVHEVLG